MNKNYKEIEFSAGSTIENAVNKLLNYKGTKVQKRKHRQKRINKKWAKRYGYNDILVCGSFNGTMLYSDTVTMDDAYISIIGKTKAEFDKSQQEWKEDIERREKEHKNAIPSLTEKWIKKGSFGIKLFLLD